MISSDAWPRYGSRRRGRPAIGNGGFVATRVGTHIAHSGLIEIGTVAAVAKLPAEQSDSGGLIMAIAISSRAVSGSVTLLPN
jgi:hypothetical protein